MAIIKKITLKSDNGKLEKSSSKSKFKFKLPKWALITLIVLFTVILLATASFTAGYLYAKTYIPSVLKTKDSLSAVIASIQEKDLITAKQNLKTAQQELETINSKYQKITFIQKIPLLGIYAQDVNHALSASRSGLEVIDGLIIAIEPYSDLIGLKTDAQSDLEIDSIEDRIVFLVDTLGKISPELEKLEGKVQATQEEINKIDPNRYPESILGKQIRSNIVKVQSTISETAILLTQAQPMIKLLPQLLGEENEKTYMILFQNDAELRPTGGFLTAYAYLKVSRGKITPLESNDIYDLDARYSKNIPAPDSIKKYLEESRWHIRNMNISPDFKVSMDQFYSAYKDIPRVRQIDGIIAIDTQVPVEILKIIGPIGVGGWGNFSAENDPRCDCPQVFYALEEIADRPRNTLVVDRKAVLGPLMHSMMANAMGSPKHLWPKLFNVVLDSIKYKHLIFYFPVEENQKTAEDFNAAGRIKDYDYDYLHINDTNFGGAKTDMFITRSVEQEVSISDQGLAEKTVTITYDNPYKGSNCNLEAGGLCLNGQYRDWVRLYVPLGSKLTSVTGSEVKEQTSEDLGKTVFEAYFTMRPESTSKISFTYELPEGLNLKPYRLLIQKQPGTRVIIHNILVNGKEEKVEINSDTEIVL